MIWAVTKKRSKRNQNTRSVGTYLNSAVAWGEETETRKKNERREDKKRREIDAKQEEKGNVGVRVFSQSVRRNSAPPKVCG